ncbi:MAG TPA: hypothetical protein DCY89_05600 [Gammaproteobacteria bacterium]|nr:hypothetical protein [Gammaproteobacteria bacterium]
MPAIKATATVASILGAGATVVQAIRAPEQQRRAERAMQKQAAQQRSVLEGAVAAQQQAERRTPDVAQFLRDTRARDGQGMSGTLLTGPAGVPPTSLTLGRNTLLGE